MSIKSGLTKKPYYEALNLLRLVAPLCDGKNATFCEFEKKTSQYAAFDKVRFSTSEGNGNILIKDENQNVTFKAYNKILEKMDFMKDKRLFYHGIIIEKSRNQDVFLLDGSINPEANIIIEQRNYKVINGKWSIETGDTNTLYLQEGKIYSQNQNSSIYKITKDTPINIANFDREFYQQPSATIAKIRLGLAQIEKPKELIL